MICLMNLAVFLALFGTAGEKKTLGAIKLERASPDYHGDGASFPDLNCRCHF